MPHRYGYGGGITGQSHGEYSMPSFGESPSAVVESHLSQILEDSPHQKYYLSAKACQGILNRAERRGKELPELLKKALLSMIRYWIFGTSDAPASKDVACVLNDQGGGNINVESGNVSPTLRAESHNHDPVVVYSLDQQGGKGCANYTEGVCPTMLSNSNGTPHAVAYCIQGNCIDRADTAGCNGAGWTEGKSYTLNTVDRPAVAVAALFQPKSALDENWAESDIKNAIRAGESKVSHVIVAPTVYSGVQVTSPQNRSNPSPGDPCHTLNTDDRNWVVLATDIGFFNSYDGVCPTLLSRMYKDPPLITTPGDGRKSAVVYDARGNGDGSVCPTITGDHQNRVTDYTAVVVNDLSTSEIQSAGFCPEQSAKTRGIGYEPEKSPTLRSGIVSAISDYIHWIVRRITPLECERLQGFPDGWTDIGEWVDTKGKKHKDADSPRYKALGNSIALPSWYWVLQRLNLYCGTDRTMASLFDGIGGFPLIWETLNGGGSCVWASEIEEFPIAVTKIRFPDA